jgi:prepilin-type N-terminal cleavage/methylation domain-containing protein
MNRRAGFTLVELLVVAGIFAMLFGMVLNGARPGTTGQVKQAAQQLASVLLATQSKAIGNPLGAAVIIRSGTPSAVDLQGKEDQLSTTIVNGNMLPFIEGEIQMPDTPAAIFVTGTITPTNAAPGEAKHGYKIQFYEASPVQPPSAWMSFVFLTSGSLTFTGTVGFRTENSQTSQNTVWPKPVQQPFNVRIARRPGRAETVYEIPKPAAIDLRYSGVEESSLSSLDAKGDIAVMFDRVGGLSAIIQMNGGQPIYPTSPLYILVTPRDRAFSTTSLEGVESLWVVVHPQTGRVSLSSNVPQPAGAVTASDVRNARRNARQGAAIGK